jgi:signal transduction histidine kinase
LPRILADARAIRQVILNLLSNAIKFTLIKIRIGWTQSGVRPRGRTGLGFDFDLLPGVVIFELRGA